MVDPGTHFGNCSCEWLFPYTVSEEGPVVRWAESRGCSGRGREGRRAMTVLFVASWLLAGVQAGQSRKQKDSRLWPGEELVWIRSSAARKTSREQSVPMLCGCLWPRWWHLLAFRQRKDQGQAWGPGGRNRKNLQRLDMPSKAAVCLGLAFCKPLSVRPQLQRSIMSFGFDLLHV